MGSIGRRAAAMVTAAAAVVLCSAVLTGGTASAASVRAGTHPAGSGGTWGKAEEVPGTAVLNAGGDATK